MKTDRREAVEWVSKLHPGAIYVVCNALARDIFETADKRSNLYLVHGMGQALAVGVGIAQSTTRKVVVVDGDGNAIMGASMWTLLHTVPNLTYYVLVNGTYQTTGGQHLILPTFEPDDMMIITIEPGKVGRPKNASIRPIETVEGFLDPLKIKDRFLGWLHGMDS